MPQGVNGYFHSPEFGWSERLPSFDMADGEGGGYWKNLDPEARKRREELLEIIRNAAEELLESERGSVVPSSNFEEDLGVDSLGLVELVMKLEDDTKIKVPESDWKGVRTVEEAIETLVKNEEQSGGGDPDDPKEGGSAGDREPRSPKPDAPSGRIAEDIPYPSSI